MDGMTDEELAAKLEEHAKHGSHAYPDLLSEASERLYALSAHVALLKASLAQAEREAGAAVAAEREACAAMVQGWDTAMTDKLATAIRARGAKGGE